MASSDDTRSPTTSPTTSLIRARLPSAAWIALGVCLVLGLITRLPGLDFGVPDLWHPDEQRLIYNPAKRFAAGEGLGLPRWPYPPLMAELVGTVLRVFPFDPPTLRAIAVGRGISAGLGIVGILATAMAAWTVTQRATATIAAGALVAWAPIAIALGHYATPDGAALGCVGLGLWACARAVAEPRATRPWAMVALGLATGLAAAFKYNAAMIAVLAVAATVVRVGARLGRRERSGAGDPDAGAGLVAGRPVGTIVAGELGWLVAAGVASILVFTASLVPVWSELGDLGRGLEVEWAHYSGRGHVGFSTDAPVRDALVTLWTTGLGGPALLAALALPWVRGSARSLVAAALLTCLAYFGLLVPQQVFFDRVVFVVIPPLAVVAGLSVDALGQRLIAALSTRWPELRARLGVGLDAAVSGLAIAAVVAVPLARGAALLTALRTPDTRALARDYLVEVSEPDARILHMPRDLYLAPTISGRENLRLDPRLDPRRALARRPHYVVFVDSYWQRFANNPIDAGSMLALEQQWRRTLARRYEVAAVFEGPPVPGVGCPGTTLSAYHQPKVTVYVRRSSRE